LSLTSLLLPAAAAAQPRRPTVDAYADAPVTRGPLTPAPPGLVIAGRDTRRGVPTLLIGRAPSRRPDLTQPIARAVHHVDQLAALYHVTPTDLSSLEVEVARATPTGGALVIFGQRVRGVEVFETRLSILLDASGALVAAGGQLRPVGGAHVFQAARAEAAQRVLSDHFGSQAGAATPSLLETRSDGSHYFGLSGASIDRPVRVQRILFPMPRRLVPAHYVELWADGELISYVISADGLAELLERRRLTVDDTFEYQVYADPAHTLLQAHDSPYGDTSPDRNAMPIVPVPAFVPQSRVSVDGLNLNPMRRSDPWLPDGATETLGNNVDAYADLVAPDGLGDGDLRASVTAPGVFAHPFDGDLSPNADDSQRQAAITHLFFQNNWLHDYFYDLGFDEAAGNAQELNFGRGGEEEDVLHAQAMDYSRRNNANMSTPRDGSSPRMQMFLWDGWNTAGLEHESASYEIGIARFGPIAFDVSAEVVLVDDGVGTGSDACEDISADLTGRIALIDRGGCSFISKVSRAEAAGAIGVIIANRETGVRPTNMTGSGLDIGIPSLRVTFETGQILRASRAPARLYRMGRPDAASSLDTTVVTHEWGHYLHRRLVACGSEQCNAESEGWGDFLGVFATMEPDDDLRAAYPTASYSNQGSSPTYFGTRRVPFSVDRAFNDLSFRHISDGEALPEGHPLDPTTHPNSEIHSAGEIWATMMVEAMVSLLERSRTPGAPYDFEQARRRVGRYVVLGMQLAPRAPTFTEQRDALIAAALETDAEDARLIAAAFASRGAGSCAASPERFSTDLVGVVEDFEVGPRPVIEALSVELAGARRLCDADGFLDAGETAWARVVIRNDGVVPLIGATLAIEPGELAISAPTPVIRLPELAPLARTEEWVELTATDTAFVGGPTELRATLEGPTLCASVTRETRFLADRDPALSLLEEFEVEPSWLEEVSLDGGATDVFSVGPSRLGDEDWVLRGADVGGLSDTALLLPEVTPLAGIPFVLRFDHRFDFEANDDTLWDGGVIELSTDGGTTWRDVAEFVDPGYTGPLTDRASNPLSDRSAYSRNNPSFPASDPVRLDFGTMFAGERVRIRIRIATDVSVGAPGWEIDDLVFTGVDPPPFPGADTDVGDCSGAPTADAGDDQERVAGDTVSLDGTGSSDPDDDELTFAWEALETEPWLLLEDASTATPSFQTPSTIAGARSVTLRLRVDDGRGGSSTDDVLITIAPNIAGPVPDAGARRDAGSPPRDADAGLIEAPDAGLGPVVPLGGGCTCRVGDRGRPGAAWPLILSVLCGLVSTRRRRR